MLFVELLSLGCFLKKKFQVASHKNARKVLLELVKAEETLRLPVAVPTAFPVLPNVHSYFYLTIRLRARDFYEDIVDHGLINYGHIKIESE